MVTPMPMASTRNTTDSASSTCYVTGWHWVKGGDTDPERGADFNRAPRLRPRHIASRHEQLNESFDADGPGGLPPWIVAGGSFSSVQEPGAGKPVLNRSNLFAFNATTGAINTAFAPTISGGFVEAVADLLPFSQLGGIVVGTRSLLLAGVLARQKAIVLGQFTEYTLVPHDRGFKLQTVVNWLRSQLKIPVLTNLPYGHVATKVLLPVGAKVDLVVEGRDALMVWGH